MECVRYLFRLGVRVCPVQGDAVAALEFRFFDVIVISRDLCALKLKADGYT